MTLSQDGQRSNSKGRKPLSGVRVVDFSRMLSGPFATMVLGDLGAQVIRVEDIAGSDTTRHNHPFVNGESHYFLAFNRNKRSISIDLKTDDGLKIAERLVDWADVVVENFRTGVAKRLGLDYPTLVKSNPNLVYCSITGFGQTGPWRDKTAYDLVIQALSGALSVTGENGRPPAKMGLPLADEMASLFSGIAVLAALEKRERTGEGSYVDLSMFDVGLSMLSYMANIYFATGESPSAQGSAHPTIYPYNAFETKDGYIVVAPFTNAFWRKYCNVLGREDLATDENFKSFSGRLANRKQLAEIINPLMSTKTTAEWSLALDRGDVPNGPVASVKEALEHEHTRARGLITSFDHPLCGEVTTVGSPFKIQYSDGINFEPTYTPPPTVGQHSEVILKNILGYSDDKIFSLKQSDVIRVSDTPAGQEPATDARSEREDAFDTSSDKPLSGLKVLDLTRMLAGPFGTLILADLGADVIKIEEPRLGDPTRHNLPKVGEESAYFMSVNRGKRSVCLDLKSDQGKEKFFGLLEGADIVIENFRPGVMERLGLGASKLHQFNKRLIICSISGFGQTGPLRDKISFDLVNQAMAGTMSITGEKGRPPVRIGLPAGDLAGGIFASLAILAEVYGRRRHGKGSWIDISLHDTLVSLLGYVGQLYFTTGEVPGPVGSGHHHIAPYRAFKAKDGYFVIAAFTQNFWLKFVKAMDISHLASDARFSDITKRKHNKLALYEIIDPAFETKTVSEWIDIFQRGDVPVAEVLSVGEALESDQSVARNVVFDYVHPTLGAMKGVSCPFLCNGKPWRSNRPPPVLGEHTSEILDF